MLKLIKIHTLWYAIHKDILCCSDTLIDTTLASWRPVVRLPRPVFLALAAEFGDALRHVNVEEVDLKIEDQKDSNFSATVTEVALEDVTAADKYVTYHAVVTATA